MASDKLFLISTSVRGRTNVQTVVSKTGNRYNAFNFVDHATEHAGPVAIEEIDLDSDSIRLALQKEKVVTITDPVSVNVTWCYEIIGRVPVETIQEIRIRELDGRELVLVGEGADYPTALLLL